MNDIEIVTSYMDKPGPTDLRRIFIELGILYSEKELEESGSILYKDKTFSICVNKTLSYQKRRFVAAHELSHYLLHRDYLANYKGQAHHDMFWSERHVSPFPLSDIHDRQANRLAIQILIPQTKVKRLMNEGIEQPAALTKHFGVSEKVLQLRLETLV